MKKILFIIVICLIITNCVKTNVQMSLEDYTDHKGETLYILNVNYNLWILLNPEGGICSLVPRYSSISLKPGWQPGHEATSFSDPDITGKLFIPQNKEWVDLDLYSEGKAYWNGRFPLKHVATAPSSVIEKAQPE